MPENVEAPQSVPDRLADALGAMQEELNHVARVLHEDIGQVLTAVGLHLDLLRQDYSAKEPGVSERAVEIQNLLEKALEDVRRLSYRLNPDIVQRAGLRHALDRLIGDLRRSTGKTIRFLMDSRLHVPLPAALVLYRIADLALDNAVKHADSSLIELTIQPLAGSVRMEIRDDGKGFDAQRAVSNPRGIGLPVMRSAARRAGLDLVLRSEPGKGTTLQAAYVTNEGAADRPHSTPETIGTGKQ
jgi:signal transduction histidine kinase